MRVVADASPLILLARSELLSLLPALFSDILIPEAVWNEVDAAGPADPAVQQLSAASWPQVVQISPTPGDSEILQWNLGRGESEVLMAARRQTDCRALLDDRAGRSCARALEIPLLGTGGLLILAKNRGFIPSVAVALRALLHAGLWLSDDMYRLLLQHAGESEA
jgi:predicted nucleic acid-binding protein